MGGRVCHRWPRVWWWCPKPSARALKAFYGSQGQGLGSREVSACGGPRLFGPRQRSLD